MPCQSRIQITTSRAVHQPESRPITANDLFTQGRRAAEAACDIYGWYVHVPFCFHKCHYCDFYSIVDSQDRQGIFVDRLIEEIHASSTILPQAPHRPRTIFVGGGTPTLLEPALWERLFEVLEESLSPAGGLKFACRDQHSAAPTPIEFTVEANPETVTPELARILATGGVNRVSIGAQSFNPVHLKTLERWHDPRNVARAVDCFRAAGIERINIDLISGIPGQTLDEWRADLDAALSLAPSHLSCYGLMYEPNTALTARMRAGQVTPIDDDLEAAMYETAIDTLGGHGFEHYEISAWASPGMRCEHNLLYWTNANWWPMGPSASGHWNGTRWKNAPRLSEYLDSRGLPPIVDVERVDEDGRIGEELMLGLRLIDGIERSRLDSRLARGTRAHERAAAIDRAIEAHMLEWRGDRLRLTRRGLLLADEIIAELI